MSRSFAQKLRAGASPEELKIYYSMSDDQYQRVVSCLQDIRKNGGTK